MRHVEFDVLGTPKPQGSKRHVGNGVMVEQGGQALRLWREDVKQAASRVADEHGQFDGPVFAYMWFYVARPKSHWRTGATTSHLLRPNAPQWPITRPDLDKVLRSTCDAITTSGLWRDDSQLVSVFACLRYADARPTGARLFLTDEPAADRSTP